LPAVAFFGDRSNAAASGPNSSHFSRLNFASFSSIKSSGVARGDRSSGGTLRILAIHSTDYLTPAGWK
jgi:hypothetical protein